MREKNCQKLDRLRRGRIVLHEQGISMITIEHDQSWQARGPCCPLSTLVRLSEWMGEMVMDSYLSKFLERITKPMRHCCEVSRNDLLHSERQAVLGWDV